MTAALRDETPSFRYTEYACVLTVFVDTCSRSPISWKERCVDSSGSSRSSAAVSEDAPTAPSPILAELRPQLAGLCREDAEVGPLLQDVVGLPEHRGRARRVGERDVGPGHLDQRLDATRPAARS